MKKIETNELTTEQKSSMLARVITAIVLAILVVPAIFLGGWFFVTLVTLLAVFSAYELVHILKMETKFKYPVYIATIGLVIAFVYWAFFKNNVAGYVNNGTEISWGTILTNFNNISVSPFLILVAAGIYFGISFVSEEFDIKKVCYLLAMTVFIGLACQSFLYLRFAPYDQFEIAGWGDEYLSGGLFRYFHSVLLAVYMVLGTIMNDIGAYFIGIFFGKHKVNPRISPKKTWEGFWGGWVISFLFSAGFALIMAAVNLPLAPTLDLEHFYWILVISALIPLFANLGDFAFSALKRSFDVKDFSRLLPGHGGILDRIDSILFVSAFIALMLTFINNGWNFFL